MGRVGSNFSKGLSVYGIPILPEVGPSFTTGNVFFVDNGNVDGADDSGTAGKTKEKPFVTVDYAINQCTSGDVIYVLPGHSETITTITTVVPDVPGISIIGLGQGDRRPTFTSSTGSVQSNQRIKITGEGTRLSNCVFVAGDTGDACRPTAALQIAAQNVQVDNCVFKNGGSSARFLSFIYLGSTNATAARPSGTKIIKNEFLSRYRNVAGSSSGTVYGIKLSGSSGASVASSTGVNIDISWNKFTGSFNNSMIYGSSSGTPHKDILISYNTMFNNQARGWGTATNSSGNGGINIRSAMTGAIRDNDIFALGSSNIYYMLDPGSCFCSDNKGAVAVNTAGGEIPVTAASSC